MPTLTTADGNSATCAVGPTSASLTPAVGHSFGPGVLTRAVQLVAQYVTGAPPEIRDTSSVPLYALSATGISVRNLYGADSDHLARLVSDLLPVITGSGGIV